MDQSRPEPIKWFSESRPKSWFLVTLCHKVDDWRRPSSFTKAWNWHPCQRTNSGRVLSKRSEEQPVGIIILLMSAIVSQSGHYSWSSPDTVGSLLVAHRVIVKLTDRSLGQSHPWSLRSIFMRPHNDGSPICLSRWPNLWPTWPLSFTCICNCNANTTIYTASPVASYF